MNITEYARRRLLLYCRAQWPEYKLPAHIMVIGAHLDAVVDGRIKRLIITMPPRSGKSQLASQFFPAFYLGNHPNHQVIMASYAQELASSFGRTVRNHIMSDLHRGLFPDSVVADDSAAVDKFAVGEHGNFLATAVGARATGYGAHLLLIDDPIRGRMDADSDIVRAKLKNWYAADIYTRLMPQARIVVIGTRWHHDDLIGWLLKEHGHENWTLLNLPAIKSQDPDPQNWTAEDALWPEMYPVERLIEIRKTLPQRDWSALYQQQPSPDEGGIFKKQWWQKWPEGKELPKAIHTLQSWDTAYSEKDQKKASYSARSTWAVFRENGKQCLFLLEAWRGRVDYTTLRREAQKAHMQYKPDRVIIEKKASGQCYDDKTEVLTQAGWKLFSEVDISTDRFATRSPCGKFEWQKAVAEVHQHYVGKMHWFSGKTHDLMVTPNHRMLVESLPKSMGGHPSRRKRYDSALITADDLVKYGGEKTKTPLVSRWEGREIKAKNLVADVIRHPRAGKEPSVLSVSGDDYIKFMAMFLAEGWTQHYKKYYGVHIGQYQTSPSFGEFLAVAQRVGRARTRRGKEIYLTNRRLYEFVRQYGTYAHNKTIPEDIMNASARQLRLFWDYYVMGDGHITKKGHQSITTTSEIMADQLQEIAQKIGYSASVCEKHAHQKAITIGGNAAPTLPENIRTAYVVRLRTSKAQKLVHKETITYKGTIHCVQVPNQVLYVRRKGYPSWCGNSLIQDMRMAGIPVATYQPDRDKIARAYAAQPLLEAGMVYYPDRRWAEDFINDVAQFPVGESDDWADTLSQAFIWFRNGWWLRHPENPDTDEDDNVRPIKRRAAYG